MALHNDEHLIYGEMPNKAKVFFLDAVMEEASKGELIKWEKEAVLYSHSVGGNCGGVY